MLLKPYLSKIHFLSGRTPVIEKRRDFRKFIPAPYKTVLLLSADLELAWASRYDKRVLSPLEYALTLARRERQNIHKILAVTEGFQIPITWAIVGHLFLHSCREVNGKKHIDIPTVPHYDGPFWDFHGDDWFEYDPCSDYQTQPEWYAPDLIRLIMDAPVDHEIGCHTFSHIDCREEACPPQLMKAELAACKKLAAEWGLTLRSFVHPGHTIGHLDLLKEEGFTSFRTDDRNVLGYPRRYASGLWQLEQTTEFCFREAWSVRYHVFRYTEIIKRAMASNTVCVCWFHPSFDPRVIDKVWPAVFQFLDENRDHIWITTHSEYIDFLNRNLDES
jgi:peptidoglycan/xylan/chitin deacetylase (PgdA/CDA1 family)